MAPYRESETPLEVVVMPARRPCTACDGALVEARPNLWSCAQCGGDWVDEAGLDQASSLGRFWRVAMKVREASRCPVCDAELQRTCIGSTIVKSCTGHGVFFAAGQLARVASVLAADEARDEAPITVRTRMNLPKEIAWAFLSLMFFVLLVDAIRQR